MILQKTFYASQLFGSKIYGVNGIRLDNVMDIIVNTAQNGIAFEKSIRPVVVGLKTKMNGSGHYLNFDYIQISKQTFLK